jgi:hypothetical protein
LRAGVRFASNEISVALISIKRANLLGDPRSPGGQELGAVLVLRDHGHLDHRRVEARIARVSVITPKSVSADAFAAAVWLK